MPVETALHERNAFALRGVGDDHVRFPAARIPHPLQRFEQAGSVVSVLDDKLRERFEIEADTTGVVVTEVEGNRAVVAARDDGESRETP